VEVLLLPLLLLDPEQPELEEGGPAGECFGLLRKQCLQLPAALARLEELLVFPALARAQTHCHSDRRYHQQLPHSCMASYWTDLQEGWRLLKLQRQ
jgi:hypothetical protein